MLRRNGNQAIRVCQMDTKALAPLLALLVLLPAAAMPQVPNWRAFGTTVVASGRAGFSGSSVQGLWLSADENSVEVELPDGRLFRRSLSELNTPWQPIAAPGSRLPALRTAIADRRPEAQAKVLQSRTDSYRQFALGKTLWQSDNLGRNWSRIAANEKANLIGENPRYLVQGLVDANLLAVATEEGIWYSSDAGLSWVGLNDSLPNLHLEKVIATPQGGRGLLAIARGNALLEWVPGNREAWVLRGRLESWTKQLNWTDPQSPNVRLEARGAKLRVTFDGGLRWADLGAPAGAAAIRGIAVDAASGTVYMATDNGLYSTIASAEAYLREASWQPIPLPGKSRSLLDVYLDDAANFLYVSVAGDGLFLTQAPHRQTAPQVVSAADLQTVRAAPGSLVTILGARVSALEAGDRSFPVLNADGEETQLQVPFDAAFGEVTLRPSASASAWTLRLPVAETAPAIFVDREGAPLLVNPESGELLDPREPLRAGDTVQILLTGLGQVEPRWPTGEPAPLDNPPRVVAPVRVWLNGLTLEVLRAELAGGYVGFYSVVAKLPAVLDAGVVPLAVEAGGRMSNTILVPVAN
ncbi:MAG: hypothetical protein NW208_12275 [Bryobacter sp.]|nr:hypothetical protein [Bryobacter sp.]